MAVYDTVENKRTEYTVETLNSLLSTVNWSRHRLIISDNGSCPDTLAVYKHSRIPVFQSPPPDIESYAFCVLLNGSNLGTAEAVNRAWKLRKPFEHAIKMDNDVVINHEEWADEMEAAVARDPRIGQVGLKRKDLAESPNNKNPFYNSQLTMLPHQPGESWIIVEECQHIMGTCVLHSSRLLDKVGYLKQPTFYGFDDSLMSLRSRLEGFRNVFLPHINIDHIDRGDTGYQKEKEKHAGETMQAYNDLAVKYRSKQISTYYNPFQP